MDHQKAVENQAVERYLLGEMPDSELEAFEMHFFACSECAGHVYSGAILAENVKAVFPYPIASSETARPKSKWLPWPPLIWAPSAAAALLVCVVAYQSAQIAHLSQPQIFDATILGSQRGGKPENRIVVPAGSRFFATQVDVPARQDGSPYPYCRADLTETNGRVVYSLASPAPSGSAPLGLMIPIRGLHSGPYTLTLFGGSNPASQATIKTLSIVLQIP